MLLPLTLLAVLFDEDITAKPVGGFDEHGCRPGMNAQLVCHKEIFGHRRTANS